MPDDSQNTFDLRIQSTYDGQGAAKAREDIKATSDEAQKAAEKVKQVNYGPMADDRASAAKAMGPSVGEEALRSEKTALLEAKRDLVLAASAQDEAGIAKLRAEVALRKITVDTLQTQAMTEKEIAVFSEEQAVAIQQSIAAVDARIAAEAEMLALKQAQVAAEQEQAAASALSGVNLGKARAEAMTLARELAAGSANTRTIGALLGSLGPLLAPMAVAGFVGFEWLKKYEEAAQKGLEAQVKLSKERAKAEREWQDIASNDDLQRRREAIEERINDLLYDRSTKQGEEREKIDNEIIAQEANLRRLEKVGQVLIQHRETEEAAAKATRQMLEDLDKMPKSYDVILDKLQSELKQQEKIESAKIGNQLAEINRLERDGKIGAVDAEQRRIKLQTQLRDDQAAREDQQDQERIRRNQAAINDLISQSVIAQKIAEDSKAASDAADQAVAKNSKAMMAARQADRELEAAQKAPSTPGHYDPETGKELEYRFYQQNLDAAKAKADAAHAQVQNQEELLRNQKEANQLAKETAETAQKKAEADQQQSPELMKQNEALQQQIADRKQLREIQEQGKKADDDYRLKEAEKQDEEAKVADQILKIENKIIRLRQAANGGKLSPVQSAELAKLEQAKIDAEAQKQSIRRPLTPAEQEAEALKKQGIGGGNNGSEIYQAAAQIFGAAGAMAGSNFGDIKKAGQAAQGLVSATSLQTMHEQLQEVMSLVQTVLGKGSTDTKIADSEKRTAQKLAELKRLLEGQISVARTP